LRTILVQKASSRLGRDNGTNTSQGPKGDIRNKGDKGDKAQTGDDGKST
jgi:hypothetical protein